MLFFTDKSDKHHSFQPSYWDIGHEKYVYHYNSIHRFILIHQILNFQDILHIFHFSVLEFLFLYFILQRTVEVLIIFVWKVQYLLLFINCCYFWILFNFTHVVANRIQPFLNGIQDFIQLVKLFDSEIKPFLYLDQNLFDLLWLFNFL